MIEFHKLGLEIHLCDHEDFPSELVDFFSPLVELFKRGDLCKVIFLLEVLSDFGSDFKCVSFDTIELFDLPTKINLGLFEGLNKLNYLRQSRFLGILAYLVLPLLLCVPFEILKPF